MGEALKRAEIVRIHTQDWRATAIGLNDLGALPPGTRAALENLIDAVLESAQLHIIYEHEDVT